MQAPHSLGTVTQRLLAAAPARGQRRALLGGLTGTAGYTELAATVRAAAAGLAWRGLQPGDAVGVYVPDAACYVLAVHAIRAAGGVPSPVAAGLTVPEIAAQLGDCGARLLLTGPPLEAVAQAAAERSLVRQVISFGDADGTVQFSAVLQMGTLPPYAGRQRDCALLPYSRDSDGPLRPAPVSHRELDGILGRIGAEAGDIGEADVVLAVPPSGDGLSYTVLLDHALLHGATVAAAGADELAAAARAHHASAVIAEKQAAAGAGLLRVLLVVPQASLLTAGLS
jgi:acyl-CoA synthetase (AMP-forming)/AMP-acid ligase II